MSDCIGGIFVERYGPEAKVVQRGNSVVSLFLDLRGLFQVWEASKRVFTVKDVVEVRRDRHGLLIRELNPTYIQPSSIHFGNDAIGSNSLNIAIQYILNTFEVSGLYRSYTKHWYECFDCGKLLNVDFDWPTVETGLGSKIHWCDCCGYIRVRQSDGKYSTRLNLTTAVTKQG